MSSSIFFLFRSMGKSEMGWNEVDDEGGLSLSCSYEWGEMPGSTGATVIRGREKSGGFDDGCPYSRLSVFPFATSTHLMEEEAKAPQRHEVGLRSPP